MFQQETGLLQWATLAILVGVCYWATLVGYLALQLWVNTAGSERKGENRPIEVRNKYGGFRIKITEYVSGLLGYPSRKLALFSGLLQLFQWAYPTGLLQWAIWPQVTQVTKKTPVRLGWGRLDLLRIGQGSLVQQWHQCNGNPQIAIQLNKVDLHFEKTLRF